MYVVTEMQSTVLKEIFFVQFFNAALYIIISFHSHTQWSFLEKLFCYATEYEDPVFLCIMIVIFYILLQIFLVSFNIANYFNYVYTSCQFQ